MARAAGPVAAGLAALLGLALPATVRAAPSAAAPPAGVTAAAPGDAGLAGPEAGATAPTSSPAAPAQQADANAAAALRASQELEAEIVELRAQIDALERRRVAFEDLRQRVDELEARLRVQEQAEAGPSVSAPARRDRGGASYGGRGLVIRDRAGRFVLRPLARLQAGYEGALVTPPPGFGAEPDQSSFLLRTAEVLVEGHALTERLEYRLQADLARTPMLKDAFLQWRFRRAMAIRIGQFKVPFGFQRYLWTARYELVDMSAATAAFSLERDIGLAFIARPWQGRLQAQLAVTNGTLGNGRNDNIDFAYALRLVGAPWGELPDTEGDPEGHAKPRMSLGASAYYGLLPTDILARTGDPNAAQDVNGDGRVDNVAVWMGALQLRAIWRGAALQAEYFHRWEHPGAAVGGDRVYRGGYVQASLFVLPAFLQVAARAGRTELPLWGATVSERQRSGDHNDELSAAISAYFRGHRLKAQMDYSYLAFRHPAWAHPGESHRLRAQVQLIF